VLQLATGLESAGDEVEILGRGPGGARGPKVLFPFMVVPAFLRAVHRFRPQVVQVHESDGALVALLTKVLAPMLEPSPRLVALLQVSYVREMRAVRALRYDGRVLGLPGRREWMFRLVKAPVQITLGYFTAWLSDVVLAPSRQTAKELEEDYGVDSVFVLPNVTGGRGIEPATPQEAQMAHGYLLFVGRLRIRKGVEVLLHAVAALREGGRFVRLMVAGDGEHRRSLEAASHRLGLTDQVSFVGGCDAGTVRSLMKGATALIVPSIYEGMPLVVLEAMENGLPVVASGVSGIPEVVVSGESGWLVPPENVAALTDALAEVLDSPSEARRRGDVGRRRLDGRYRPEHAAKIWSDYVSRDTSAVSDRKDGRSPLESSSEQGPAR
jgi:glycosyltransferase involved in cell wall biosynthesis